MTDRLTLALAQLNPTVGDVDGNLDRIADAWAAAAARDADLLVATELAVTGYPPEDLILKPFFVDRALTAVTRFARERLSDRGPAVLLGTPWRDNDKLYNAAVLIDRGQITDVRLKHVLPNYGVFDEKRLFAEGPVPGPINFRDVRLGVMVCEDMWVPDVAEALGESGAELLVVINGSPFDTAKYDTRIGIATARVTETRLPLVYVNQVGGQDELVFDGASFALSKTCRLVAQAASFAEDLVISPWRRAGADGWVADGPGHPHVAPVAEGDQAIYQAMVLGLRDYVNKNRFPGVILGLSGGIDSALSAAVAVDALGADRIHAVMLPSPYTSRASRDDATEVAELLGCRLDTIDIEPATMAVTRQLAPAFAGRDPDITEENLQSRARGLILMALSNKFGAMVLSTGNKSEMSVGYATLYGDMCGGYSVLKDVYKTTVYRLARLRNGLLPPGCRGPAGRVIPERVLTKAPTAELKPNQTDQDTLPPYPALDDILECLIERDLGIDDIVARGHARAMVSRVWHMVDRAEYKRRQAPPGVKITPRSFGRDRRYPITNQFVSQL